MVYACTIFQVLINSMVVYLLYLVQLVINLRQVKFGLPNLYRVCCFWLRVYVVWIIAVIGFVEKEYTFRCLVSLPLDCWQRISPLVELWYFFWLSLIRKRKYILFKKVLATRFLIMTFKVNLGQVNSILGYDWFMS